MNKDIKNTNSERRVMAFRNRHDIIQRRKNLKHIKTLLNGLESESILCYPSDRSNTILEIMVEIEQSLKRYPALEDGKKKGNK